MYQATEKEIKELVEIHGFSVGEIEGLDIASDKARRGIPIDFQDAIAVSYYQPILQSIRKKNKRWWKFWG